MAAPPLGRTALIRILQDAYEAMPGARAAFLGGSDATGRTDELSDIDLVVIVGQVLAEIDGDGQPDPPATRA